MRRRDLLALIGGAALVVPRAGWAQETGKTKLLGVLWNGTKTDPTAEAQLAIFGEALGKLAWTDRNPRIEYRWNAANPELSRQYAAELVGLTPNVIVTVSTINLRALRRATGTIPIVFVGVSDPVGQGFVSSLAEPGGNITGFSNYDFTIAGKWLGLLKEIAPGLKRVGYMFRAESSPQSQFYLRAIETAGRSIGVEIVAAPVHDVADIEPAMAQIASRSDGGLIIPTDQFLTLHHQLVDDLAVRYRVPEISINGGGALMQYVIVGGEQFRQAAGYVDRILKGAKPADLPVQNPTKFQLVINLKTAKALGITVPPMLLARADEVIE